MGASAACSSCCAVGLYAAKSEVITAGKAGLVRAKSGLLKAFEDGRHCQCAPMCQDLRGAAGKFSEGFCGTISGHASIAIDAAGKCYLWLIELAEGETSTPEVSSPPIEIEEPIAIDAAGKCYFWSKGKRVPTFELAEGETSAPEVLSPPIEIEEQYDPEADEIDTDAIETIEEQYGRDWTFILPVPEKGERKRIFTRPDDFWISSLNEL